MQPSSAAAEPGGSDIRESPDPRPPSARARGALRAVTTVHAAALFTQAILAGRFLSGDYDMLTAHAVNANVIVTVGLVQVVVAVVYWRRGRGPGRPAAVSAVLLVAEAGQAVLGYQRSLGVHVPLGVTLIAAGLLLLVQVWRPLPPNPVPAAPGDAGSVPGKVPPPGTSPEASRPAQDVS
ncbi:hypothetical protein [Streptomyces carpinensis]|uniref:hypothetical protein n=1 Tax=Streptomyces carpinensis TaxID=66369 RepID=UPI000A391A0D|nr:hypothetical protein [Streptomyces carpinensis]